MNKKIFTLLLYLMCTGSLLYAQKNIVHVSESTGTANISIPLFNVQSGSLSLPVSLNYNANGVKVKDIEGDAGMNWQLNAGGKITRQVRGLPDDCIKHMNGSSRLGWLNNTNGTKINNFSIANDNNTGTCTDEASDINYITTNFSDLSDTEPDIFYVNAPGLGFKLVFDNDHHIRTMPYQDVQITFTVDTSNNINSFTIINDKGIKYVFGDYETIIQYTYANTGTTTYNKNYFSQYQRSGLLTAPKGISYNSAWNLTEMSDPNGNKINLNYDCNCDDLIPTDPNVPDRTYVYSVDSLNTAVGAPSNTYTKTFQYQTFSKFIPRFLTDITYSNANVINRPALSFSYVFGYSGLRLVNSIKGYGKVISFSYIDPNMTIEHPQSKNFLQSVNSSTGDCVDPQSYLFEYQGVFVNPNYDPASSNPALRSKYITALPDSTGKGVDYWGYYNGASPADLIPQMYVNPSNASYERYRPNIATNNTSNFPYLLTGTSRDANPATVATGSLSKITYADGGTTTLTYDSNDFYDPTAAAVIQGGGIRVKQITDYDGSNTANNIVKNYSYLDPNTGQSSGKPISMPIYAFTIPYTGTGSTLDQWNYSTVRAEDNLSQEDNTVIYGFVKESMTGAGSTLYQFTTPATYWDASASPDWSPTVMNIARPTCASAGFMRNDKNTYPFAPNTNFDFERGLISKMTSFNDSGQEVSESVFTYTRMGTPVQITGLKFEQNATLMAYAKYKIYVSTGELTTQVTKKVFDSPTLSLFQQSTSKYYYTGAQHKLITHEQTINSDGTIQDNYTKYTKDYAISPGADSTANGIYRLQKLNINVPVERYNQVTQNGTTTTVGGNLVKFKTVNPTGSAYMYLPAQKLKFSGVDSLHANGVSDFQASGISSNTFTNDSRYIPVENDLAYDFAGALLSKDDNYKHVQSTIIDHITGASVTAITNARFDEIGYNDFNSTTAPVNFIKDNNVYNYSGNSRSGQFALSLEANATLSRTIVKNSLAKNYIYSVWINSTTSGNINITVNGNAYTLTYVNSAGIWKYYEIKMPVTALPSTFTTQFQSSQPILIDDVLFYPDVSEVATYAYDPLTNLKTAETNTNGVSNYYSYDMFNRLKYVYDQDKNIVEKKNYYLSSAAYTTLNNLDIIPKDAYTHTTTFSVSNLPDCIQDQVTAVWNFGDGSATVTGISPTHTYVNAGNYTVTVTLTSIFFVQKTIATAFAVHDTPPGGPDPAVRISYSNSVPDKEKGHISMIVFQPTDPLLPRKTLQEIDLINGSNIPATNYNITVYVGSKGTPTWHSVSYSTDLGAGACWPSSQGATITTTMDLSTTHTLSFTISPVNCPLN